MAIIDVTKQYNYLTLSCNRAWEKFFGYEPNSLLNTNINCIIPKQL